MDLKTPNEWSAELANRLRAHRVAKDWTQQEMAERSGMSLGSYKRFEQTGRIELLSLIKVAQALHLSEDFETLFQAKVYQTLDEVERATETGTRRRAAGKSS